MTEAQTGALAYLDANFFIDFAEGTPEYAEPAKNLLLAMKGRDGVFATSELTLAEVLAPNESFAIDRRVYLNLIVWNPTISLIPVSRDILYETAELRRFTRHKLPDAIHVVTALRAKCRFVISRDKHMNKLPMGVTRLDPCPSTIAILNEALRGV